VQPLSTISLSCSVTDASYWIKINKEIQKGFEKHMRKFSFTKWLNTKETFNSYAQYKYWLSIMSKEDAKNTNLYYRDKYQYFLKYLQTEWD